jgi:hypothetical protein
MRRCPLPLAYLEKYVVITYNKQLPLVTAIGNTSDGTLT